MTIQFNNIPGNLRVPLFYAEVNAAQSPFQSAARLLLVGQMLQDGSATAGQPVRVFTDAAGLFGTNSMLARMIKVARANAPFQEIWALPLNDNGAGAAASGAIIVRTPTQAKALADANITVAGSAPDTLDGVQLALGDLVVLQGQTAPAENGLYEVTTLGTGANGTWERASSMDADAEAYKNRTFYIAEGADYGGTSWEITTATAITLGTTGITIAQLTTTHKPISLTTTVAVWVAGVRIQTVAYTTDTAQTLAARLAAAINASDVPLPVSAAVGTTAQVNTHVVTATARHKGEAGNSLRFDLDYHGTEGPTSKYVFSPGDFSGGSGDPDLQTPLGTLGDEEFDWIACPYSDATNLGYVESLMNGASGRWSPYQQIYGHYICARAGASAALASFGAGRNDAHASIMGMYKSPSPVWDWAAAVGAQAAVHLQSPPELSRPLQTLNLQMVLAPKDIADRFDITTRQALYFDGISGYHVERDGTVSIDRLITTYQLNEWGDADASFLDVNTIAQTMYGLRYLRSKLTGQWGRAALANENPFGIQGLATPEAVRNTVIHGYRELVALGVYENEEVFEGALVVERNATDANRLDMYLPADKVNQLRIIAVNYTSFLQFGSAAAA